MLTDRERTFISLWTMAAAAAGAGAMVAAFAPAARPAPVNPDLMDAPASGAALDDLTRRINADPSARLALRTPGWAVLDIDRAPDLGFGPLDPGEAQRINAFLPGVGAQGEASPFILRATGAERARALLCLTQAIYYEAALEPPEGQEAVAQTILNRVRSPAFPKSICGVVYQGAKAPGCQFSFACDGSRDRWKPQAPYWQRASAVAEQAVNGFVMKSVGLATSYHADYVFPNWGPTLVKIGQFGAQIFYRFPGPLGRRDSFDGHYSGRELAVSMAGPPPSVLAAIEAARAGTPGADPTAPLQTYTAIDPTAPGGVRTRVAGQIEFGRRSPTPDEIARINASLAAMDGPAGPGAARARSAAAVGSPAAAKVGGD